MLDCLSFNTNVIEMINHSSKCGNYIQQKKAETYKLLTSYPDIDKVITPKEGDPRLDNYDKVFQILVDSVPSNLAKDAITNTQTINRQTLVLLHSYFEYHVTDLLDFLFKNRPELLKTRQKVLNYQEILDCANFNTLLDHMIKKEIRSYEEMNYLNKRKYFDEKIAVISEWESKKYGFMINDINDLRNKILHNISEVNISTAWIWEAQEYLLSLGMHLWLGIKEKFSLEGWLYPYTSKRKIA